METREHILCVYGDNFFNSVKYKITFLPLNDNESCQNNVRVITDVEPKLVTKKSEMSIFQEEYMSLKKRFFYNFYNSKILKNFIFTKIEARYWYYIYKFFYGIL